MDIKELEPIILLMTQQEERFVKKIGEVHEDVITTRDDVKKINGRLRHVEGEVVCMERELEDIRPTKPILKHINLFMKHPKKLIFLFIVILIGVQALVIEAFEKNWIGELLKFIKP